MEFLCSARRRSCYRKIEGRTSEWIGYIREWRSVPHVFERTDEEIYVKIY